MVKFVIMFLVISSLNIIDATDPNAVFKLDKVHTVDVSKTYVYKVHPANENAKFPLDIDADVKIQLKIHKSFSSSWTVFIRSKNNSSINITKIAAPSRIPDPNIAQAHFYLKFQFNEIGEFFGCIYNVTDYESEFYIVNNFTAADQKLPPDEPQEKFFVYWRIVKGSMEKIKMSLDEEQEIFEGECHRSLIFGISISIVVVSSIIMIVIVHKYYNLLTGNSLMDI